MAPRFLATLLLFAALLPAGRGAAQEQDEEGRPQIFLEKQVYSHTAGGKRSFYETHTVEKGETLWKILESKSPLTPERYAQRLQEFRKANPGVADPSHLTPGQKILVPSGAEPPEDGRTVSYAVKKGDNLTKILESRGVPKDQWKKYLSAVREINPAVKDVNRIFAGKTLRLPTEAYFGEEPPGDAQPVVASAKAQPPAEEEARPAAPAASEVPPPASVRAAEPLSRDVERSPGQEALAAGKPGAELLSPSARAPDAPIVETGKKEPARSPQDNEVVAPPARSPYRGLLSDLFNALGEKWVERGTMYLPIPSGGEVILRLSDFPIVRFSGGTEAVVDFGGGLPSRVREAITGNWPNFRVVSLSDAGGAAEMIDRILAASGYYSVKDGLAKPVVIGENVSVTLPARWIVQRTDQSLLSGDLVLIKEVPEKPDEELLAVLRYARRVGVRVLPYAVDPTEREGFLAGLGEEEGTAPVALSVPKGGGLPAVDFGLSVLGIQAKKGERLRIGGKGDAFQLVIQPERVFEAGGKRYVVDTGKVAPGVRTILKESGYMIFPAGKDEPGREIFRRLLSAAEVPVEERKEHLLAGGAKSGYAVRVTGSFMTLPAAGDGGPRKAVLVRGNVHSGTRALVRDLGVEIVEW